MSGRNWGWPHQSLWVFLGGKSQISFWKVKKKLAMFAFLIASTNGTLVMPIWKVNNIFLSKACRSLKLGCLIFWCHIPTSTILELMTLRAYKCSSSKACKYPLLCPFIGVFIVLILDDKTKRKFKNTSYHLWVGLLKANISLN